MNFHQFGGSVLLLVLVTVWSAVMPIARML